MAREIIIKRQALAILLVLVGAFTMAMLVGIDTRAQEPAEALRVVTMPLEPFVIADGDRLTGFSVDLWDAVADQLGMQFQWVKVESVEELLAAVKDGQADVVIVGISMTPEREQVVDFTIPCKLINEALLELMQDGTYTEIHNKWFGMG